jgi:hypothetical protein
VTALTYPIRFYDNDFSDGATISASSSASGFSYTNAATNLRSEVWKPSGAFYIYSGNSKIYINDGSNATITLTTGTYTQSSLASHIQTKLNASSSGWTVAVNSTTYKFTISRSSTGTLRFSETSSAAWDLLGYTLTSDTSGTSWTSEERRIHSAERYVWDFGIAMTPTFIAAIGPINEVFSVSSAATCKVKFNNVPDDWDNPDLSITLTRTDKGVFGHLDSETTIGHRYACFEVSDRTNALGADGLKFGRIWIGDHLTFSTTNVDVGFAVTNDDRSETLESDSGVRYYRTRAKRKSFKSAEIKLMTASERISFEETFELLGISEEFFISVDPGLLVSSTIDETTFYATFSEPPELEHVIRDYYNVRFEVEESV